MPMAPIRMPATLGWNVAVTSPGRRPGAMAATDTQLFVSEKSPPVRIAWIFTVRALWFVMVIRRADQRADRLTPEIDIARRDGEDRLVDGHRHGEGQAARLRSVHRDDFGFALADGGHESVRVDRSDVLVGRAVQTFDESRTRRTVPSRKRAVRSSESLWPSMLKINCRS